jgi:hypothetical protein
MFTDESTSTSQCRSVFCKYGHLKFEKDLQQINSTAVGFEILSKVLMRSSIPFEITPCSPLKVSRFFGGSCLLWPPLWSSGQSSCLQFQRPGFDSLRYQIFWEVAGLARGPFRLMTTTEELLGRKSSGFGLELREYGRRDPSLWPRGTLYPQMLILTSPTSGGRSAGIGPLRTQVTEFFFRFFISHFRFWITNQARNQSETCSKEGW